MARLWAGTNAVAAAVVSGLAAVPFTVSLLRVVLLAASAASLASLAAEIAFAGAKVGFIHPERAPGATNGLLLQPINPEARAGHATLFSGFAFPPAALEVLIMNLVWIPIHCLRLWAGVALRRLDPAPGVQRAINAGMAAAMLAVVGLAAWSRFSGPG